MKVTTRTTPAQLARELNSRRECSAHIRLGKPDRYPWLGGGVLRGQGFTDQSRDLCQLFADAIRMGEIPPHVHGAPVCCRRQGVGTFAYVVWESCAVCLSAGNWIKPRDDESRTGRRAEDATTSTWLDRTDLPLRLPPLRSRGRTPVRI